MPGPSLRWGPAEPFMRSLYKGGTGADTAYKFFTNTPMQLPRSVVRQVWRTFGEEDIVRARVGRAARGELVPKGAISEGSSVQKDLLRYDYTVLAQDKSTNELFFVNRSLGYDKRLTPEQAENLLKIRLDEQADEYGFNVASIKLNNAFYRSGRLQDIR